MVLRFIQYKVLSTIHPPFNLVCRQSLSALFQKLNNNNPLLGGEFSALWPRTFRFWQVFRRICHKVLCQEPSTKRYKCQHNHSWGCQHRRLEWISKNHGSTTRYVWICSQRQPVLFGQKLVVGKISNMIYLQGSRQEKTAWSLCAKRLARGECWTPLKLARLQASFASVGGASQGWVSMLTAAFIWAEGSMRFV